MYRRDSKKKSEKSQNSIKNHFYDVLTCYSYIFSFKMEQ